ncbi:MAG TPA: Na+/H+ antiporter [Saprospiraceae bacterium]
MDNNKDNGHTMHSGFIEFGIIILIILALVMVADKLKLAYPIVLVVGGLFLSFFAAFPNVAIDPDLVFFIFLPPLLYDAAWQVSWKEFWKWRRVITSFAFPVVILTSCVIAYVSSSLIPGFTLALGFLLGGIIAPPDAISATTIMRKVKAPKSLVSIAEGESLLNDATSLIILRFALAAVITGQFHFQEASVSFLLVVFLGAGIGIVVGMIFYAIHRWLPVTTSIEIILTFVTPYCMYYAAEHFHFSGVLAVVCGGLYLSNQRQHMLSYISRIQATNVWNSIVFVLNGLIFLLIGLQLPSIVNQLGDISLAKATGYAMFISLVLIITRLFCALGASLFTRFMSQFITVADPNPGWKSPLILGWAGMRGVVSLAAALSIPLVLSNGDAFPHRNLILYITFVVILVTLVAQGLSLPWLIRKLDVKDKHTTILPHHQEAILQKKLAHASLNVLESKYPQETMHNLHLKNLSERLKINLNFLQQHLEDPDPPAITALSNFQDIYLELLEAQREILSDINRNSEFDEDLIRKYLALVDIEEHKIREKKLD